MLVSAAGRNLSHDAFAITEFRGVSLGLDKKEKTTMKYLTALLVMVKVMFLGCGETKEITTEDIIKRVNSTGIITDEQAESLSKVESLSISEDLQPLINIYKNQ